jgi:transposase
VLGAEPDGSLATLNFREFYFYALHAVHAGLTESWSNGPVEGFVHKLKLIKRSMYGRASFGLLRSRVLGAS